MEDFQVLTIPQIRSRLNQLNVPVPSNTCRKQELIDLLVQTLNSPPKPETRKRSVSPITVQKHPKAQSFFVKEVPSEAIPSTHLSHHKLGPIAYNPSTSLSNQKTDIFKQRMEAAFSQAQIEDAEIQSSSSVQLKESLGQIVIFIGILVSILLLSYVVRMWMAKPVFCGNGIIENCEQCPKNAICEGGNMACEPGYVRDRYACVEDKSVVSEAYKEL